MSPTRLLLISAICAACILSAEAGRDYYDLLGVPRDAAINVIKKSYRRLARLYHPDKHPGDKKMENKFKDISQAYEVLADENKRATYDQFGEEGLRNGGQQQNPHGFPGGFGHHGGFKMEFDSGSFEDMFGGGFGSNFGGFGGHNFGHAGGWGGGRGRYRQRQQRKQVMCFQNKVCENGSCFMVKECN